MSNKWHPNLEGKFWIIKFIVTITLLSYVISRINFNDFFTSIKQIRLEWYLPFFMLLGAIIVLAAFKLKGLLETQGIGLCYKEVFKLSYLGFFFNNVMLGSVGGDLVKMVCISNQTNLKIKAVVSVVFDRLIGFVAILLLSLLGVLIDWNNEKLLMCKITIIILIAGALFLVLIYRLLGRISSKLGASFRRIFQEINEMISAYNKHKVTVLKALFISFIMQFIVIIVNIAFGKALGIEIPAHYYFVIIPITNLFVSLPISIGGWGVSEAGYGYFFGLVNMTLTQAVALSLVFRLSFTLWTLPGGLLLLRAKVPMQNTSNSSINL